MDWCSQRQIGAILKPGGGPDLQKEKRLAAIHQTSGVRSLPGEWLLHWGSKRTVSLCDGCILDSPAPLALWQWLNGRSVPLFVQC
ncbi:hypothetical protein JZ751_002204, partial [Albula glossodonta]